MASRRRKVKAGKKANAQTASTTLSTGASSQGVAPRFVSEIRNIMTLLMNNRMSGPFKTVPNLPQYKTIFPKALCLNAMQQKAFRNPSAYTSFKAFDNDIKILQRQEIKYDNKVSSSVSAQRKHKMEIMRSYYDTLSRPFLTHGNNLSPNQPKKSAAPPAAAAAPPPAPPSPKPSAKKKAQPPQSVRRTASRRQTATTTTPPAIDLTGGPTPTVRNTSQTKSRKRLHFDSPSSEETKSAEPGASSGAPKKKMRMSAEAMMSTATAKKKVERRKTTPPVASAAKKRKVAAPRAGADDEDEDVLLMSGKTDQSTKTSGPTVTSVFSSSSSLVNVSSSSSSLVSTPREKRATSLDTFSTPVTQSGFSFGSSVTSTSRMTSTSNVVSTRKAKRDDTPRYGERGGHSKLFGTEGRPPSLTTASTTSSMNGSKRSFELEVKVEEDEDEKDDGRRFMRMEMGTPMGRDDNEEDTKVDPFSRKKSQEGEEDDGDVEMFDTPTRTREHVAESLTWKRFELAVDVFNVETNSWDRKVVMRDGFELHAVVKKFFDVHPECNMRVVSARYIQDILYDDDDDAN